MKRAVLIVVSAIALVGLLIADIAYPKTSIAEESPAAEPAAQAAATPEAASVPEAATSSVPKNAIAEAPDSASQGTKAEEASAPGMPGSIEAALDQLDEPAAAGASASGATGDEKENTGEAAPQHNDAPASEESVVR